MQRIGYGGFFKFLLVCSVILLVCADQARNNMDLTNPALKIKYTNDFKFLLKSGNYLGVVKELADGLGFVYKLHITREAEPRVRSERIHNQRELIKDPRSHTVIVREFYLFIRDDIRRYSDSPYDAGKLQAAQERLSLYVVSIVQDYERIWVDTLNFLAKFYTQPEDEPKDVVLNSSRPFVESAFGAQSSEPECEKRDVFVAFIDIGFELEHPNLINSTSLELSYDFILEGHDVKPYPYSDYLKDDHGKQLYERFSHGTGCMGRVGATEGNGCDRGVAQNVTLVGMASCSFTIMESNRNANLALVGLKAMDKHGGMTDTREALALTYQLDRIDVFSCSYGFRDNIGFYEPKPAAKVALMDGATKGRDCRGVLYIYPSGNGHLDNCNADGYANSIYTITIAQVQRNGDLPGNTEICSAAIAAAQGNGYSTTKLNGKCSAEFEGSSASCAVAAGFVGELIFYKPCLSKRDIEHIMVRTAIRKENIRWSINGVNRKYNDQIGFGELDLDRMLEAATTWKYVPEVHTCAILPIDTESQHVTGSNWTSKKVVVSDGCRNKPNHVQYLEHVQVEINLRCSNIFHVTIRLTSPSGTVSNILTSMNITEDVSKSFNNIHWNFTSVHFWGESSNGLWSVAVVKENSSVEVECKYNVTRLILYGTDTDPEQGGDPLRCKGSPVTHDIHAATKTYSILVAITIVVICCILGIFIAYIVFRNLNTIRQYTTQTRSNDSVYMDVAQEEVNTSITQMEQTATTDHGQN